MEELIDVTEIQVNLNLGYNSPETKTSKLPQQKKYFNLICISKDLISCLTRPDRNSRFVFEVICDHFYC